MTDDREKTSPPSTAAKVAGALAGLHFLAGTLLMIYLATTTNFGGGGDPGTHVGTVMAYLPLAGLLWIFGSVVSLTARPWNVALALLAINQASLAWSAFAVFM